jgi:hypothetical protein
MADSSDESDASSDRSSDSSSDSSSEPEEGSDGESIVVAFHDVPPSDPTSWVRSSKARYSRGRKKDRSNKTMYGFVKEIDFSAFGIASRSYECRLCDRVVVGALPTLWHSRSEMDAHCRSEGHVSKVVALQRQNRLASGFIDNFQSLGQFRRADRDERFLDLFQVMDRAKRLGLPAWSDAVVANVFWCLMREHDSSAQEGEEGKTQARLAWQRDTLRQLDQYELMERLSLLELAVWKAECLASAPEEHRKDPASILSWFRSGWKENKEEARLRSSSSMTVIANGVLPFLVESATGAAAPTRRRGAVDRSDGSAPSLPPPVPLHGSDRSGGAGPQAGPPGVDRRRPAEDIPEPDARRQRSRQR